MQENKYKCSYCNKEFDFRDVKYGEDGKRLFCEKCLGFHKKELEEKKKGFRAESGEFEKVQVICIDCRYKFSISRKKPSLRCPYCNRSNIMKDDTTADELISEVTKNPDMYR